MSSDHLWQGITFSRGDWLGEVGNALIYSSSAYGITHAYAADSHQFLWENSNIQIDSVIGRAKNIIVALSLGEYGGFTTVKKMYGLDQGTGELLWTVDMGSQPLNAISVLDDWILWNSHYQQTKHQIHIVSAKTGVEQQVFSAPGAGIGYFQEGDLIIVDTWEQIFIFK